MVKKNINIFIKINLIKKKQKYQNHRGTSSLHKPVRNYVNSYINHIINNKPVLEDFIFPSSSSNTYTWWDCKPLKPTYNKEIYNNYNYYTV